MSRVSGNPYFVYVIWSDSTQRFYVGISENPQERLEQHNSSEHGWTRRYRPRLIVHTERYEGSAPGPEICLGALQPGHGVAATTKKG